MTSSLSVNEEGFLFIGSGNGSITVLPPAMLQAACSCSQRVEDKDLEVMLSYVAAGDQAGENGHAGVVSALCEVPMGLLASGGADGTVRMWQFWAEARK